VLRFPRHHERININIQRLIATREGRLGRAEIFASDCLGYKWKAAGGSRGQA
jgi:hypothetical protein